MRRLKIVLGVLSTALLFPEGVHAEGASNRAAAEALFKEGRSLAAKGSYAEACPKFEASQQLDPGLGTLLNLAECYEKLGKTASAWAEYREAIPLARASGSKVRENLAMERARALESRLSTLTIRAMNGGTDSAALEVRRDGVPVQAAEFGSPIPVDPGPHVVEASAPGRQNWKSTMDVADAAKISVEVPALAPVAASPAPPPPVNASPSQAPTGDTAARHSGATQRTTAVVVGGLGIVGVGLGTVFGLQASSKWSDAKSHCTSFPYGCDQQGLDAKASASSRASISTEAFIVGGAALATSAVLWFTAPSDKEQSVAVGVGPGSAFVRGSF